LSFNTIACIDLSAIQANLKRVKELAPQAKVMAMVKANAYGHGLVQVAQALHEADVLGVARIHEALTLRQAGITTPIILMEGILEDWELPLAEQFDLIMVVHQPRQIEILQQANKKKIYKVWLKVDTGMHRLGFLPEDFLAVYQKIQTIESIQAVLGVMSHFASAEELEKPTTQLQMDCFANVVKNLKIDTSLANSAGIIAWPASHHEWVRPGLMLYGVSPFEDKTAADLGLTPAMTLSSKIISINFYPKNAAIGYNGTYLCPEAMPVGIVATGYGDGYPRYLRHSTPICVNQTRTQIIGRVSMDMIAVDLRPIPNAKIGDCAELWGNLIPVEEVAKAAETSFYELLTGITQRVGYQYIK
jgi:alanine racemase